MIIDGKTLALAMYANQKKRVLQLQEKNITPHLVVILVGEDPASVAYIKQKKKWGTYIGAKITVMNFPENITTQDLLMIIEQLNSNKHIHGIIIQRPLPKHIDKSTIASKTAPEKDIDGFHPQSPYGIPVALAVLRLLEEVFTQINTLASGSSGTFGSSAPSETFKEWLASKTIVCLGKGGTAGTPIIKQFNTLGLHPTIIDSKTEYPDDLLKQADIIIAAVGRSNIITARQIKEGAIVIGVGITKDKENIIHGDYQHHEIERIASFYTPTPGGVGPVNVAYLLDNLIKAAEHSSV